MRVSLELCALLEDHWANPPMTRTDCHFPTLLMRCLESECNPNKKCRSQSQVANVQAGWVKQSVLSPESSTPHWMWCDTGVLTSMKWHHLQQHSTPYFPPLWVVTYPWETAHQEKKGSYVACWYICFGSVDSFTLHQFCSGRRPAVQNSPNSYWLQWRYVNFVSTVPCVQYVTSQHSDLFGRQVSTLFVEPWGFFN